MKVINIVIVDDDSLIVSLLHPFLESQQHLRVVATFSNGREFCELLGNIQILPDILLLDLKMQGMDGIEVSSYLKEHFPSIKIIVISSHYQLSFLNFMIKTGVAAFLPKGISPNQLVQIITLVDSNGFYFMEDQIDIIKQQLASKSPKPFLEQGNALSNRELDVLKLLCKQKTAKEIGESLFITQRTVEGHKNNLFVKTGAKNVAGLIIYSIQHSIIKIEDLPAI